MPIHSLLRQSPALQPVIDILGHGVRLSSMIWGRGPREGLNVERKSASQRWLARHRSTEFVDWYFPT